MNEIKAIEASQMKNEVDDFKVGDTVKVHFRIIEGKTERIQIYEGLVIAIKNSKVGKTYGSQEFLRSWGREGIPHSFSAYCQSRGRAPRKSPQGKTLLYPGQDR